MGDARDQAFCNVGNVFTPLTQRSDGKAERAEHLYQLVSESILRRTVGGIPFRGEDQPLTAAKSAAIAQPLFLQVEGETLLQEQCQAEIGRASCRERV